MLIVVHDRTFTSGGPLTRPCPVPPASTLKTLRPDPEWSVFPRSMDVAEASFAFAHYAVCEVLLQRRPFSSHPMSLPPAGVSTRRLVVHEGSSTGIAVTLGCYNHTAPTENLSFSSKNNFAEEDPSTIVKTARSIGPRLAAPNWLLENGPMEVMFHRAARHPTGIPLQEW